MPAPTASNTLEGPEAKGCELLVRSIDLDVGGGDENHVPWLELRSGFTTSVVVQGVLILGLPERCLRFVKSSLHPSPESGRSFVCDIHERFKAHPGIPTWYPP